MPASPVPLNASPVSLKLSTYDGKTNWEVYKTQFSIISEDNGWTEEVMPFGLCNAPATFERLLETVLGGLSNCPTDVHQLLSFLGLCTYYRKFVKNFSTIARPLHKLTEAKQKIIWTVDCNNDFNKLKDLLTSAPILAYPEIGKQFILDTDTSHESNGAVLSQEIDGQERVIAYFSKCLSKPGRNYCVTRKELLAIEYDVEIRHRKGSTHRNADALSRRPCPESCKYCSRIEKKFKVIGPIIRQDTTPSTSELYPWSDESVRKLQLADPEIKPIIEFKESSDEKLSWQDIVPFHPTTKRYWALWDSLHLRNGVLYRKWESDDGKSIHVAINTPKDKSFNSP
ncbi:retrovirus-related Pol polyprotein from transposon opus [Trichonephila clavipes]|nr:retrovirus-related Pol polyprotein from transposon opus [Trichonephila clavipes]